MDHLKAGFVALARIRQREFAVSLAQFLKPAPHEVAYRKFQSDWQSAESSYDFAAPSLQNELLAYFRDHCHLAGADDLLCEAEAGRLSLWRSLMRPAAFGLHSGNAHLWPLLNGFTEAELYLLNQIIINPDSVGASKNLEVAELAARKFKQGDGLNLAKYLAKRLEQQANRLKRPGKRKQVQMVNYSLVVIGRLWTDPNCPLWLAPSAGAVKIITGITGEPLTYEAYNNLVKRYRLTRIPQRVLDQFFSVELKEFDGLKLRQILCDACEFEVDHVRRGQPRRRYKKKESSS